MHLAVQFQRWRAGTGAQAVHRAQADGAVGAGAVVVQRQLFAQLRGQRLGAPALARLGAAKAQGVARRWRGAEIVVEADHPTHLGQAEVQGMGNFGDSGIGDVADVVLDGMQDRQQRAGGILVTGQNAVDHRQVEQFIRHTADLGITDPA